MGAAAGNAHGKKKAREQVALIQRDDLQSSLSRASARLGSVRAGIAEMTTAQDAERAELKAQVASGELSEAAFDARMEEMVETRAQVAEALTTSAERAKQAQQQIAEAQGQGQEGLGWHAEMADEIEQDALSARASISLL